MLRHARSRYACALFALMYLLLVLARLVPVVAQVRNIPWPWATASPSWCPAAASQASNGANQRLLAVLSKKVLQINNRLNRLENLDLAEQKACARTTVAEGLQFSLTINRTASFSVLARDCRGYDLTTGGDNVTATLASVDYPSCLSAKPTVVDDGDGSYQVSLIPKCSGNNLVSVSINEKTIKYMPMTIAVIPPYTSLRLKRTIERSVLNPYAIGIAENGDVFLGGWNDHHVHHFDKNGTKLNSWRTPGNNIHGILVHGKNIYVSQCTPPEVFNYTQDGILVGPSFISGCYPDLVIGPDGRLYASDCYKGLISIFDMEDGSLYHQFTGITYPRGIGFDLDGNLHVARWYSPVIQVFTRSGVLLHSYTPPSSGHSDGVFIDRAGNVLVADRGSSGMWFTKTAISSKVIITDKNNNLLHKLAIGLGEYVNNVAIAPNGDVWVTNAVHAILIYSE